MDRFVITMCRNFSPSDGSDDFPEIIDATINDALNCCKRHFVSSNYVVESVATSIIEKKMQLTNESYFRIFASVVAKSR
jgi:hypothetical protein